MRLWLPLLACGCLGPPAANPFEVGPTFEITVAPDTLEIVAGPNGSEPVPFTATVHFPDGTDAPPDAVEWGVSNRSIGDIGTDGLFTASGFTGGEAWITAEVGGVVGRADLKVRYHEDRVADGIDVRAFDATPTPTTGAWVYPQDGVNLPRNTPSLLFEWNAAEGAVYRLDFTSHYTSMTVYTDQHEFVADGPTWATIAGTNAGGEVSVVLSAALADGTVLQEAPRTLHVNRMDAEGSVIYWSTTSQGLIKLPWGGAAVNLLTPNEAGGHCVGCHALSNDGKIAFSYDGGNAGMGVKRVADMSDIVGPVPDGATAGSTWPGGNFKTFSPDGRLLLSTFLGNIKLYDADTGALLKDVLSDGTATHVDWSPDGKEVVFVRNVPHEADWAFSGPSQIAVLPYLGNLNFGSWRVVFDPQPGWKAYYPTYSPDGNWIAFNQSTGDAYNDPDAELWVIDAGGKRPPVRLTNANGEGVLTNSWPHWAPLPDDDVLWLAFSSTRAYGTKSADKPQIWVAGFDPKKAEQGVDPSWPAFWLTGQDSNTSNHQPFWIR